MGYFKITDLGNGIWKITEKMGVSEYLIVGTEKALLIDTGYSYGRGFLKRLRKITTLPIMVVNTHFHPDHSGKNNLFHDIYIGKNDIPNGKNEVLLLLQKIRKAQPIKGTMYSALMRCPKIKSNYIAVGNGMKFELGNRNIEVIEMPGHTPGSIILLDEKTKTVFAGDAVNTGTWLFTNEKQKLDDYEKRLYSLSDQLIMLGYENVLFSHQKEKLDIGFLKEYADFINKLDITYTKTLKIKGLFDRIHIGMKNSDKYGKMMIMCYEKQF